MKYHGRLTALLAIAATSLSAAPFVALGDGAELFLTAKVSITSDDNIYLRHADKISDVVLDVAPGLDLVFGRQTATQGNVFFSENIVRYSDNDVQNTELANAGFNLKHDDGKMKIDAGASYVESAQNNLGTPGQIVPITTTGVRALTEIAYSEKTSFAAGVRWDKQDYTTAGYRDSRTFTVPLDVYVATSPKLQTSFGYRYRTTDISNETAVYTDSKDHFFNIGARGEFTGKLSGQIRVGYGTVSYDSGVDSSLLGIESGLTYAYSPKTTYQLNISNDFGTSALGEATKAANFYLSANNKIDEQWSWNAYASYRTTDYPSRNDDLLAGGVGVAYVYNSTVNFAAGYSYKKNNSDAAAYEFSNNVFNLSANIRY